MKGMREGALRAKEPRGANAGDSPGRGEAFSLPPSTPAVPASSPAIEPRGGQGELQGSRGGLPAALAAEKAALCFRVGQHGRAGKAAGEGAPGSASATQAGRELSPGKNMSGNSGEVERGAGGRRRPHSSASDSKSAEPGSTAWAAASVQTCARAEVRPGRVMPDNKTLRFRDSANNHVWV